MYTIEYIPSSHYIFSQQFLHRVENNCIKGTFVVVSAAWLTWLKLVLSSRIGGHGGVEPPRQLPSYSCYCCCGCKVCLSEKLKQCVCPFTQLCRSTIKCKLCTSDMYATAAYIIQQFIQLLNVDTTYFACMPECTPHPIGSYMVLGVYGLIAQLILMAHNSCRIHGPKFSLPKAT